MNGTKWSQRDHRVSLDNLSAYLDGELEPRQAERIQRHVAICDVCERELSALRQTQLILRSAPVQPLPRSFALPQSVAMARPRANPWNTGFVFLRGAAVALSLILAVLLSGNTLLSTGVLELASAPAPHFATEPEPVAAVEHEALVEQPQDAPADAELSPAAPVAALAATAPQPNAEAAPRAMAAQQVADQQQATDDPQLLAAAQANDASADAGGAPQGKTSPADQRSPLTALAASPRPPSSSGEAVQPDAYAGLGGDSAGLGGGADEPVAAMSLATPEEAPLAEAVAQPTTALTLTPSPVAPAPVEPAAVQPATASPTATLEPLAAALPTQAAPAQDVAPQVEAVAPQPQARVEAAALQGMLRTGAGVLAGLLLMVAGGLLWTGHKRRR